MTGAKASALRTDVAVALICSQILLDVPVIWRLATEPFCCFDKICENVPASLVAIFLRFSIPPLATRMRRCDDRYGNWHGGMEMVMCKTRQENDGCGLEYFKVYVKSLVGEFNILRSNNE